MSTEIEAPRDDRESNYMADKDFAHERALAEDEWRTAAALARVAQRAVEMTHSSEGIRALSGELHNLGNDNLHELEIARKIVEGNTLSANVGPKAAGDLAIGYGKIAETYDKTANTAGDMAELERDLNNTVEL